MGGVAKNKYSDDFLVDYIDKRVRIAADNYRLGRLTKLLLAESTIWTALEYKEEINSETVKFADLTPKKVITGVKAIINARAYSSIPLDRFIKAVETLHNQYRRALVTVENEE